jgi:hydroxymethylpyrimidine/phosphomethylpyrimidine kinase
MEYPPTPPASLARGIGLLNAIETARKMIQEHLTHSYRVEHIMATGV